MRSDPRQLFDVPPVSPGVDPDWWGGALPGPIHAFSKIFVIAPSRRQYRDFLQHILEWQPSIEASMQVSGLFAPLDGDRLDHLRGCDRAQTAVVFLPDWFRGVRDAGELVGLLRLITTGYYACNDAFEWLTIRPPRRGGCACGAVWLQLLDDPVSGAPLVIERDVGEPPRTVALRLVDGVEWLWCRACAHGFVLQHHVLLDEPRGPFETIWRWRADEAREWRRAQPIADVRRQALLHGSWEVTIPPLAEEDMQRRTYPMTWDYGSTWDVSNPSNPEARIIRVMPFDPLSLTGPADPLPPLADLDEGLRCCHATFPTYQAYMAHRRATHPQT